MFKLTTARKRALLIAAKNGKTYPASRYATKWHATWTILQRLREAGLMRYVQPEDWTVPAYYELTESGRAVLRENGLPTGSRPLYVRDVTSLSTRIARLRAVESDLSATPDWAYAASRRLHQLRAVAASRASVAAINPDGEAATRPLPSHELGGMDVVTYLEESVKLAGQAGMGVNAFLIGFTASKLTDEQRQAAIEAARRVYIEGN